MAYARNLGGQTGTEAFDLQQDSFAGRPPNIPDWAYRYAETGLGPAEARALISLGDAKQTIMDRLLRRPSVMTPFQKVAKKQASQFVRTVDGRKVPLRAPGTRLYVPGYLGDLEQDRVDFEALDMMQDNFGVAPIVFAAATSLIHGSSTGASNAATDAAYSAAMSGSQAGLDALVRKAGYGGGGLGMAVGAGAKEYAQGKLLSMIQSGAVDMPTGIKTNRDMNYPKFPDLPYGTPNLVGLIRLKSAIAQVGAAGTTTPGWQAPVVTPPVSQGIMAPGGGVQAPSTPSLPNVFNITMPSFGPPPAALPPGPGPEATTDMPGGELPPQKPKTFMAGLGLEGLNISPMMVSVGAIALFLLTQGKKRGNPRRRKRRR